MTSTAGTKLDLFNKLKKFLSLHFEAVVFGELHWKKDVMRKIEDMIIPEPVAVIPKGLNEDEGSPPVKRLSIRMRNFYYMKCRNSIDEYISRLLYRQDHALWEEMEHL